MRPDFWNVLTSGRADTTDRWPGREQAVRARSPGTRVAFVDLARAVAVLLMILGHTLQVLLGPGYQDHVAFGLFLYLRGLTSCAFLLLSGFSFALATDRRWDDYRAATPRLWRRLRRLGLFLLLGYAMRTPIRPLARLPEVTAEQWQAFAAVDILHLVAVTLATLQALTWLSGTRRRLGMSALAAAAAVVLLTPLVWRVDWNPWLPVAVTAYLSERTGSLFPLFPWAAYILFGATLGVWFVTRPVQPQTGQASRRLLLVGASMIGAGTLLSQVPLAPFGPLDFWRSSPNLFLVKAGSVLALVSATAWVTRARTVLPRLVSALSRESLVIYFVHVCILYGSIWNNGLGQAVGPNLALLPTLAWAAGLLAAMALLAWLWHECKRWSAGLAALVRALMAAGAAYAIL